MANQANQACQTACKNSAMARKTSTPLGIEQWTLSGLAILKKVY